MSGIEFDLSKINKYQFDGFIGNKSDAACSPETKFAMGDVRLNSILFMPFDTSSSARFLRNKRVFYTRMLISGWLTVLAWHETGIGM